MLNHFRHLLLVFLIICPDLSVKADAPDGSRFILEIAGGQNQQQRSGTRLLKQVSVRVLDSSGEAADSIRVRFSELYAPEGSEGFLIEPDHSIIDQQGMASCYVKRPNCFY